MPVSTDQDPLQTASLPPSRADSAPLALPGLVKHLTAFREFVIIALIVLIGVAMSFASPVFLTKGNLLALLLGLAIESIVAIGMTILMVAGSFDLSVGSTLALSGAVAALCMTAGLPPAAAIVIGLMVGAGIGVINGVIVAIGRINPFITTLGMMSIVRGLLMVLTSGQSVSGLPKSFKSIGQGYVLGIQYPILIAGVLILLGDLLLRKNRIFRQNYYIGGNEKAAVLSGIPVRAVTIFNYALIGFLAALAGIVNTARLGSASVTAGTGLELKVIAAVIIGGASLQGGEGTVLGSFLGALLMAIIISSLTLLGVDVYWQTLVIGATLLMAVTLDTVAKRVRT
jgi:ribose transport system permease protein